MKNTPPFLLLLALVALSPLVSRGEPSPAAQPAATQPSMKYRLTRQAVAGLESPRWVFIVVTPEGHPWVATAEKLQQMIERAVPANATLEWAPGCKRVGGEPLETVEELDALNAFCQQRQIHLVHHPGG